MANFFTVGAVPQSLSTITGPIGGLQSYAGVGSIYGYGLSNGALPGFTGPLGGSCGVAAAPCGALPALPAAVVGTPFATPCAQYLERAVPSLYMLAAGDCGAFGRVCCNGQRPYRSYALANALGGNNYVQKGLNTIGVGCNQSIVAVAPVIGASACPCTPAYA